MDSKREKKMESKRERESGKTEETRWDEECLLSRLEGEGT